MLHKFYFYQHNNKILKGHLTLWIVEKHQQSNL